MHYKKIFLINMKKQNYIINSISLLILGFYCADPSKRKQKGLIKFSKNVFIKRKLFDKKKVTKIFFFTLIL